MAPYLLVVLDVDHQDSDQALLPPRIVQLPSVPIWKSCLFYPMRKVSPGMWQLKSVNYFLSSEPHLYSMFHVLDYLPHKNIQSVNSVGNYTNFTRKQFGDDIIVKS